MKTLALALLLAAPPLFASEHARTVDVGLISASYESPVRAARRPKATGDYETWDFTYMDKKFMTAVFGLEPKFPTGAVGVRKPKDVRVGAFAAHDITFKRDGGFYREVRVEFGDEFPPKPHFYYHGLSKARAAQADAIIASLRSAGGQ